MGLMCTASSKQSALTEHVLHISFASLLDSPLLRKNLSVGTPRQAAIDRHSLVSICPHSSILYSFLKSRFIG
jgi:hypothetical protein